MATEIDDRSCVTELKRLVFSPALVNAFVIDRLDETMR